MKKKSHIKKFFQKNHLFFFILVAISTLFLGIGYAQISDVDLSIEGTASLTGQTGVIITDVSYLSSNNVDASGSKINSYYQTMLDSSIVLGDSLDSSITYQVKIKNSSDSKKIYTGVLYDSMFYDNPDIEITVDGLNEGDSLNVGEEKTFMITFHKKQETDISTLNSYINFRFDEYSSPSYFYFPGACTFNGAAATITGDECSKYADQHYINTGIQLYSEENYQKDFIISFDIDHYLPSEQNESQATLLNAKLEDSKKNYPGFVFRRDTNNLEITSGAGTGAARALVNKNYSGITKFKIIRMNMKLYYSYNDESLVYFQDNTKFNNFFDTPVTIGASLDGNGNAFRHFKGTLSNIYINVGDVDFSNYHVVSFDGNGGSSSSNMIESGQTVGSLPTTTRGGWIFEGWYTSKTDGERISGSEIINANVTYYAHWRKAVGSMTFESTNLTIEVGNTDNIVINNASDITEEWTYSSLNNSIATVTQDGVVTAVSSGTTKIRIKGKTSGQTKDITITVPEVE